MAERRTPARRDGLGDPPSEVHIEIQREPGRGTRLPPRGRARGAATLAAVAIAGTAVAIVAAPRDHHPGRAARAASERGAPGVAGAYGYPQRCLAITVDVSDPAYARADFDRRSECGRYHGYTTAIFHRVHGRWRVALDTANYSCPVESLPKAVQVRLDVCPFAGRTAR